MFVYLAGPLFSEAERAFNLRLTVVLEQRGHRVFLPQRDGIDPQELLSKGMSEAELTRTIFTLDRDKIYEADVLLFILDGRVPDEGACVELGLAYGQKHLLGSGKLLLGLDTDWRAAFQWAKRNAMVEGALDTVVESEDELMAVLEALEPASV